jgi:hypothetical protein
MRQLGDKIEDSEESIKNLNAALERLREVPSETVGARILIPGKKEGSSEPQQFTLTHKSVMLALGSAIIFEQSKIDDTKKEMSIVRGDPQPEPNVVLPDDEEDKGYVPEDPSEHQQAKVIPDVEK